jgi:hypothetical protein
MMPSQSADTFDYVVHITADSAGYRLNAECVLSGETPMHALRFEVLDHFVAVGQALGAGTLTGAQLRVQGEAFFRALFTGDAAEHFAAAHRIAADRAAALRLVFRFEHAPELHELPWEILHDGRTFLATLPHRPVVRYVRENRPPLVRPAAAPLRILMTTAAPADLEPLALDAEASRLQDAVLNAGGGRLRLKVLTNASFAAVHDALVRAEIEGKPYHVWHHAGHGGLLEDGFHLALVRDGRAEMRPLHDFGALVTACPSLMLVFLNVCYGGSGAGMAAHLAHLCVPCVIAHRSTVLDRHALDFAARFYPLLPESTVEAAVGLVRSALYADSAGAGRTVWAQPVVYARTSGAVCLLAPPATAQAAPAPTGTRIDQRFGAVKAAGSAVFIGQANLGNSAPAAPPAQLSLDVGAVEGDDVLQIGQLNGDTGSLAALRAGLSGRAPGRAPTQPEEG